MQIPEDMFKVEVQLADEIRIGDFIVGTWNDIDVETFTHATTRGEVQALEFPLMTLADHNKLSTITEVDELDNTSYIFVTGVYRRRVPPPEVRGTVIDILEFQPVHAARPVPQRAIWTGQNIWATDTGVTVESAIIQQWTLVAAAPKQR